MKKQQRFTSERAIHAEINDCLRRIFALTKEAEQIEDEANRFMRAGDVETGEFKRAAAGRIRRSTIPRIQTKLVKLKEALSEFKTPLLLGMPGDEGVNL